MEEGTLKTIIANMALVGVVLMVYQASRMLTTNQFGVMVVVVVICALLTFGGWYAKFIALRKPTPGKTWVEVVIGVGVTITGAGILIYVFAAWWDLDPFCLSLVPIGCFLLTGLPMILGQELLREIRTDNNRKLIAKYEENLNGAEEEMAD